MTRNGPAIILLGSTGYTGRLVARSLAAGDTPFVLTARDPDRLRELATGLGTDAFEAVDVQDSAALDRVIRPGDAVINTVGPFTELGDPVVRACIRLGAHYVDTTGEQPWMHRIRQRYHDSARTAGVCIVNAMAFEYALGDAALALAALDLQPPIHTADVVYSWRGAASSRGTRRTVIRMLGRPGLVRRRGAFRRQSQGSDHRAVRFESGARRHAVAFQCGEIVTAPRHLEIHSVRGWLVMGARMARIAPLLSPALPVLVPLLRPLLEPLVTRKPDPTAAERAASGFTIRVELSTESGRSVLEVQGRDPYGVTAEIAIQGARRALEGEPPHGVLAPAQLVEPERLFAALEPFGVRLLRPDAV